MKKTVFIILAGLAAAVSAQGFVRIDTLYTPYFDFDYEGWIADSTHPLLVFAGTPCIPMGPYTGSLSTHPHPIYADRLEYNYIEGGADIYGIAVYTLFFTPEGIDPNTYPFLLEYLYLYEAQTDTLEELAAIPFDNTDSVAYLGLEVDQIPGQWANPAFYCDDHHYRRFGSRFYSYNFFFDKPIHVEDSFYVGSSSNNAHYWPNPDDTISRDHQLFWGVLSTDGLSNDGIIRYDSTCWMPPRNCKLRIKRNPYTVDADSTYGSRFGLQVEKWGNFASHEFFLILPILRTFDTVWTVDTPACTPVHGLGIMSRFGDTITLRWSHDGSHNEWQLSYGPQGIHPDNGTFVTCHNNRWRFKDTLNVPMVAYVRTVCRELDTLRYSDWCEPVEWMVQGNGIDPANPLAEYITIMPNPATDMVSVSSEFPLYGIEVYSSAGTKLLDLVAEGRSASFSVHDWSKGVYLVVVHTSRGILSKKLVVE